MSTVPDMSIMCGIRSGIHTARWTGTTHDPVSVWTVITPLEAKTSWSRSWKCRGT